MYSASATGVEPSGGRPAAEVGEGDRLGADEVPGPARPPQAVEQCGKLQLRRQREAVPDVALAASGSGDVHRGHEHGVAGGGGALNEFAHQAAVALHVELKPERPVADRRHRLDGAGAHRGQAVGQAGAGGGARHGQLAAGIGDAGEPGRSQHQRDGQRLPQQGGGGVDDRHVAQDPRREAPAAVRGGVGAQRHLVLRTAVDVAEHAARQPAPRQQAQLGDVHRPRAQPLAAGTPATAEAHDRAQGLQHASRS